MQMIAMWAATRQRNREVSCPLSIVARKRAVCISRLYAEGGLTVVVNRPPAQDAPGRAHRKQEMAPEASEPRRDKRLQSGPTWVEDCATAARKQRACKEWISRNRDLRRRDGGILQRQEPGRAEEESSVPPLQQVLWRRKAAVEATAR